MKRLVPAVFVVLISVVASGCAAGDPKPTTYISDTGATVNGNVYSSFAGDTTFWWRYGETTAYGNETTHRTVAIADDEPHPVSQPISGLSAATEYHFQLCVQDEEEDPPRVVCSTDRTFTTASEAGTSGIAFVAIRGFSMEIYSMDADGGNPTNLTNDPAGDAYPAWSPDGTKIAFASNRDGGGEQEIYVMDADGGNPTNLSNDDTGDDITPAWSPDGSRIAFASSRDGNQEIYVMDADGGNQTNLTNNSADDLYPAWSPDGTRIAFTTERAGDFEIYSMNADGGNPVNLTNNGERDVIATWSPDGTRIAFGSSRDGNSEVYVMDADGGNPTNLTNDSSTDQTPAWSPDGTKIVFATLRDGDHELYSMDANGGNPTNLTNDDAGSDVNPAWSPRP